MGYDSSIQGTQVLTVTGTASLPQEVNNSYGLSLEVSIQVYVEPGLPGISSNVSGGSGAGLESQPSHSGGLNPLPSGVSGDPFL